MLMYTTGLISLQARNMAKHRLIDHGKTNGSNAIGLRALFEAERIRSRLKADVSLFPACERLTHNVGLERSARSNLAPLRKPLLWNAIQIIKA